MLRWSTFSGFLIAAAAFVAFSPGIASAQDRRQNAPGECDFYVLSLSWSPSFCEEASERGNSGRSQAQCGGRPVSFVVHGLWPQYERGLGEGGGGGGGGVGGGRGGGGGGGMPAP